MAAQFDPIRRAPSERLLFRRMPQLLLLASRFRRSLTPPETSRHHSGRGGRFDRLHHRHLLNSRQGHRCGYCAVKVIRKDRRVRTKPGALRKHPGRNHLFDSIEVAYKRWNFADPRGEESKSSVVTIAENITTLEARNLDEGGRQSNEEAEEERSGRASLERSSELADNPKIRIRRQDRPDIPCFVQRRRQRLFAGRDWKTHLSQRREIVGLNTLHPLQGTVDEHSRLERDELGKVHEPNAPSFEKVGHCCRTLLQPLNV